MPAAKPFTQNEVRSGLLVVTCLGIILALIFVSGKAQLFQETYDLRILFNYTSGLKKNAPVHLAGHEIGKVTDIHFQGGEEPKVEVTVTIRKEAVVKEDSEAFINILGFMGETYIELSTGSGAARALASGEALTGTDPVPMMEVVKRGTEILEEFEKISESTKRLLGDLEGIVDGNKEEMDSIFQNLDSSSANLKDMTADLKQHPWKLLKKGEG